MPDERDDLPGQRQEGKEARPRRGAAAPPKRVSTSFDRRATRKSRPRGRRSSSATAGLSATLAGKPSGAPPTVTYLSRPDLAPRPDNRAEPAQDGTRRRLTTFRRRSRSADIMNVRSRTGPRVRSILYLLLGGLVVACGSQAGAVDSGSPTSDGQNIVVGSRVDAPISDAPIPDAPIPDAITPVDGRTPPDAGATVAIPGCDPPFYHVYNGYCSGMCNSGWACFCADGTLHEADCPLDHVMACEVLCVANGGWCPTDLTGDGGFGTGSCVMRDAGPPAPDGGSDLDGGVPCDPPNHLEDGYCSGLCDSGVLCDCADGLQLGAICPTNIPMACAIICAENDGWCPNGLDLDAGTCAPSPGG